MLHKAFLFLFVSGGILAGLGLYWVLPFLVPVLVVLSTILAVPVVVYLMIQGIEGADVSKTERSLVREKLREALDEVEMVPELTPSTFIQGQLAEEQMARIKASDEYDLLEKMPVQGHYKSQFSHRGDFWQYSFSYNSIHAQFKAEGEGDSPHQAFAMAKYKLEQQIRHWHQVRFKEGEEKFVGELKPHHEHPKALIIDDDIEMGMAMSETLKRIGFDTEVISTANMAHRRIGFGDADVVFLDWMLADDLTGDHVIRRANRLINYFPDLQSKFHDNPVKVVTFSTLEQNEITMPPSQYIQYHDHWHKSISHGEFEKRAHDLIENCA